MKDVRGKKFTAVLAAVNDLLYERWAPIGFVGGLPRDEYEAYAVRVVSMLRAGAGEADIATYLAQTGQEISGRPMPAAPVTAVARRLLEFKAAACAITSGD